MDRANRISIDDTTKYPRDNPNSITAGLSNELNHDKAALYDWYMYCRSHFPTQFRGWTIERFQSWNEQRILELDTDSKETGTTAQVLSDMQKANGYMVWNNDSLAVEHRGPCST